MGQQMLQVSSFLPSPMVIPSAIGMALLAMELIHPVYSVKVDCVDNLVSTSTGESESLFYVSPWCFN